MKGRHKECLDDFLSFVYNAAHDIDPDKGRHQWAIERYCEYRDLKLTNRVVDFIMEKV